MSRSAFAARFTTLVGEPAMQYVTRWRMHLAHDELTGGDVDRGRARRPARLPLRGRVRPRVQARDRDAAGRGAPGRRRGRAASLGGVTVEDVPERGRYELREGGELLGWVEYLPAGRSVIVAHTEVLEGGEGRGLGSRARPRGARGPARPRRHRDPDVPVRRRLHRPPPGVRRRRGREHARAVRLTGGSPGAACAAGRRAAPARPRRGAAISSRSLSRCASIVASSAACPASGERDPRAAPVGRVGRARDQARRPRGGRAASSCRSRSASSSPPSSMRAQAVGRAAAAQRGEDVVPAALEPVRAVGRLHAGARARARGGRRGRRRRSATSRGRAARGPIARSSASTSSRSTRPDPIPSSFSQELAS